MSKILTVVVKEIREALPATIFFIFLFHLIGLSKAVVLEEYSFTALRAVGATVGALIVAKAILLVEVMPIARIFSSRRIFNILWRTLLSGVIALLFRLVEELIPHVSRHDDMLSAIRAMIAEVSWALFGVLVLWMLFGLFFYTLASELIQVIGKDRIKEALFSRMET